MQPDSLSGLKPAAALAAQQARQRAASFEAQQADGVQGFKDAVAKRAHDIDLAAVTATAAHEAHLRLMARRKAARAAAARQAAARRAARPQPTGSGSGTTARPATGPAGSPQEIAQQMLDAAGQGGQFSCLNSLWGHESGWNVYASNPGSGAYGIPQAEPGSKMASAGPDWQSNAATQIRWGLSYIDGRYGSPCGAWSHEESDGWY